MTTSPLIYEFKGAAKSLRADLSRRGISLSSVEALGVLSEACGMKTWNAMRAHLESLERGHKDEADRILGVVLTPEDEDVLVRVLHANSILNPAAYEDRMLQEGSGWIHFHKAQPEAQPLAEFVSKRLSGMINAANSTASAAGLKATSLQVQPGRLNQALEKRGCTSGQDDIQTISEGLWQAKGMAYLRRDILDSVLNAIDYEGGKGFIEAYQHFVFSPSLRTELVGAEGRKIVDRILAQVRVGLGLLYIWVTEHQIDVTADLLRSCVTVCGQPAASPEELVKRDLAPEPGFTDLLLWFRSEKLVEKYTSMQELYESFLKLHDDRMTADLEALSSGQPMPVRLADIIGYHGLAPLGYMSRLIDAVESGYTTWRRDPPKHPERTSS